MCFSKNLLKFPLTKQIYKRKSIWNHPQKITSKIDDKFISEFSQYDKWVQHIRHIWKQLIIINFGGLKSAGVKKS